MLSVLESPFLGILRYHIRGICAGFYLSFSRLGLLEVSTEGERQEKSAVSEFTRSHDCRREGSSTSLEGLVSPCFWKVSIRLSA